MKQLDIAVAVKLPVETVRRLDQIAASRGDASRASTMRDLLARGLRDLEGRGNR